MTKKVAGREKAQYTGAGMKRSNSSGDGKPSRGGTKLRKDRYHPTEYYYLHISSNTCDVFVNLTRRAFIYSSLASGQNRVEGGSRQLATRRAGPRGCGCGTRLVLGRGVGLTVRGLEDAVVAEILRSRGTMCAH